MSRMNIFIADVTDDFRLSKKRLIKKLEEMNAVVHCRLPPPYSKALHDQEYHTISAGCDVNVHILSQYPGRTFDDSENVYISVHQAEAGLSSNNRKVFWMPRNLELEKVDEDGYREFLSTLDFGIEDDQFILLKGDPQTLDADIVKVIPFPEPKPARNGILIVHHSKDEEAAIRVGQFAAERNIQAQYNTAGDAGPGSNLRILAEQLKGVEQVVIVVGSVNSEWANERAKHILATIIHKDYQLNNLGFYFTPEAGATFQFNGRFLPVRVLDETSGAADGAAWNTFLNT